MNLSSDRPVSLDLGMSSQPNFDSRSDNALGNRPDLGSNAQPNPDQHQQEQDALKLRELLEAQEPATPTPPAPPPLPDLPQEPNVANLQPFELFGQSAPAMAITTPATAPTATASTTPATESPVAAQPETNTPMAEESAQQDLVHRQPSQSHADPYELEQDARRLRKLQESADAGPHEPPPQAHEQSVASLRPFDLFGNSTAPEATPAPAEQSPAMAELEGSILRMASRLMVGETTHGAVVRMELAAENLPGVVVEVYRDQGAIVAQFICANEQSRTRLVRAVPWLGESLSTRLSQDTLVRVVTDDPEDPSPVETRHQAFSG
ncbi:hypothetical protein [Ottowia thiooxydans]|uniref:Uncharacterized protein n=1 Tax=Ottowia thiooxydans TaxID=219182 RepID=A0ABV2QGE3_9BURK